METTEFFREAMREDSAISWKDIMSDTFVKHSQADREYALQTGTYSRRVPEAQMLQTWRRPWLWWVLAKYGMGLIMVLYVLWYVLMMFANGVSMSLSNMVMIIPPLIIPIIIMVFLWELNVPQDISVMDLVVYFIVGGILCFAFNSLMFIPFESGLPAYYAAVREEPAKLFAVVCILFYIERGKKQKIYGFTGLVVGAVVGAAFSGIESVSYAINFSGDTETMIYVQLQRAALALGGHISYCVPYATAIALKCRNQRLTFGSFFNFMTLGALALSMGLHAVWNGTGVFGVQLVITFASVFLLLYWAKQCFRDIAKVCYNSGAASAYTRPAGNANAYIGGGASSGSIAIRCNNTRLAGMHWQSSRGRPLTLGRQQGRCDICFPQESKGVSRVHCKIVFDNGQWYLQDQNSSYGTFAGGRKLRPYELYPLHSGENIYLGSKEVWLTVV